MFRILLDARMAAGGVGRYATNLRDGLERSGRFDVTFHAADGTWDAPFTPWGRMRVGRAARAAHADLVHGLHIEIPRFSGPTVATIHDIIPLTDPESMPNSSRRAVYRKLVEGTLRSADHVVVPSSQTAADLSRLGVAVETTVIPMGIGAPFVPDDNTGSPKPSQENKKTVLVVTGSKPHKNAAILHQVVPLVGRDVDVAFIVVGWEGADPPEGVEVRRGVADVELARLYREADVLLLPSTVEGFGFPALEAAACGTPVVCSARVGAGEWIPSGVVPVDVRDPKAVAASLLELLSNDEYRAGVGSSGAAEARELTVERMARETATVYEALSRSR